MGRNPKDAIQVAPRRKEIAYDHLPYPGIGKFRMGASPVPPGKTVSANCRLSQTQGTAMFLRELQRRTSYMGKPKGVNTSCILEGKVCI
jgi:hypothetical protein